MSTFKQPLRSGDKAQDAVGAAVLTQAAAVTFDGGADQVVARLPRPYQILEIYVDTLTAFDAATTNTGDLGIAGDTDRFAASLAIGPQGRVLATSDASEIANLANTTDDGGVDEVLFNYAQTGTAATTGAARVSVVYASTKVLTD